MATFFRIDGWVKTTQGVAVPGAKVYVLAQPANLPYPPSPLISTYSDSAGLFPLLQPIITDGFGHYNFYAAPGQYTIAVYIGTALQQVYTDQLVG